MKSFIYHEENGSPINSKYNIEVKLLSIYSSVIVKVDTLDTLVPIELEF